MYYEPSRVPTNYLLTGRETFCQTPSIKSGFRQDVTKMPNLRKIRFILKPNLRDSDAALVWKLNDFLGVKHRCEKQ